MKGAILVTGASGFIGRRLSARLLKDGARLRCLLRPGSPVPPGLSGAEVVRGDLLDRESLKPAFAGIRAVFHCAALVRPRGLAARRAGLEKAFFSVNSDGAYSAAAAAAAAGAEVFVHLGSIAAQGPGLALREDSPCAPLTVYGRSKLASEDAVRAGIAASRCRLVTARLAMIYGKDSPSWGLFFSALRRGLLPLPGRGSNRLSVCWAESLADALLLLAGRGADGRTYTVSEGSSSWSELAAYSAAAIGKKPLILKVPHWPLGLVSRACEAAGRAAGLAFPACNYIAENGAFEEAFSDWEHDVSELRALGWSPRLSTPEALAAELR